MNDAFPAMDEQKRQALFNALVYGTTAGLAGAASIPAVAGGGAAGAAMLIPTALSSGALAGKAVEDINGYMQADKAYANQYGPGNRPPDMVGPDGPMWFQPQDKTQELARILMGQ